MITWQKSEFHCVEARKCSSDTGPRDRNMFSAVLRLEANHVQGNWELQDHSLYKPVTTWPAVRELLDACCICTLQSNVQYMLYVLSSTITRRLGHAVVLICASIEDEYGCLLE